jgi:hypothetical protein
MFRCLLCQFWKGGPDGKLILTASPLCPGGFTTIKEKMNIIFRTLSLGVAMPFMQGCDLLNPTNCRINTVVNMGVWMDLYDTLCKFGFGIQNISKDF